MSDTIPRCKTCWHRKANHTGATALKRAEFPTRRFTDSACGASACTCGRFLNDSDRTGKPVAKPKTKAQDVSAVSKPA